MEFESLDPDSLLAQAIAPYLDGSVYVAPAIAINFIEGWQVCP